MTNALCSTSCGELSTLPTNYFNCITYTRKYDYKYFVLKKCDYQFTNILSPAEWTAAEASGDIITSPPGVLTLPTPEQTVIDIDGDTKVVADITYTINFITYQVSQGDNADCMFFKALYENASSYVLMWYDNISGDERWYIQDDWIDEIALGGTASVTGTSPGFKFSVTQIPHWQAGEANKGQWATQFQIEADGMLCYTHIPGAAAAIEAASLAS